MVHPTTSLNELKLPPTVCEVLRTHGYATVGALAAAADGELLKLPRLGRRQLILLREAVGQDTRHLLCAKRIPRTSLSDREAALVRYFRALRTTDKKVVARIVGTLARQAKAAAP